MVKRTLLLFAVLFCVVCARVVIAQEYKVGGVYGCAKEPAFLERLKMSEQTAIDTTVVRLPGVVLRELDERRRLYQKPSWRQAGNVGGTVRDSQGNIYVIPVPTVSLELNPLEKRNIVYKIDAQTGVMSEFVRLPLPENTSQSNPFGTLALALDCDTSSLYVSSVAGSGVGKPAGSIYQIDLTSGKVVDDFFGFDAVGLGIFNFPNEKRLYMGDARSSSVYSIVLSRDGQFSLGQAPRYELSLLALKNGNSTQVKKIRFHLGANRKFTMRLSDADFSYRMQASTGRRFRHYEFVYDPIAIKWNFQGVEY